MQNNYNWADLAFGSKKPLSNLNATFIAAPREMSAKRFIQLVKTYLPKGNIVLGLANEHYIDGFEGQAQFKTLQQPDVKDIIDKVNASGGAKHIYTLTYFQRELNYILEKVKFVRVVLINGSWQKSFHTLPAFYTLINTQTPYVYESPFANEQEAMAFAENYKQTIQDFDASKVYTVAQMMNLAADTAKLSFDTAFQVGVVLGKKSAKGYKYLARGHNKVVPYETYAWHNGASREQHFSPPNDQNFYDTVHAETCLILNALDQKLDISGGSVFINVLPCPSCARMLCATPINELFYQIDHSDGYAVKLLESAGKKVVRIVQ